MKRRWIAAAVLTAGGFGLGGVAFAGQDSGPGRADDLGQLERIKQEQYDAWYREDGAAFAASFAEDADLVTFNGDHLRTRDGIAAGMQYYFDNYIDHTMIKETSEEIRWVSRDLVVIVRNACQLEDGATECRADSMSTNTNVLVKRHGTWLQESFQNTRKVALP